MKKKQKILKKIEKNEISSLKLLVSIEQKYGQNGLKDISSYFVNLKDHEDELLTLDKQLLEIVLQKLVEINDSSSEVQKQVKKIDVLTYGQKQLMAFCRQKSLISIFEYMFTIKNKSHRQHSYYGMMLVNAYPQQFFIGSRCTHYHCKTTAHKIERQYGIFNNSDVEQNSNEYQQLNSSEDDFVVDDEEEVSQEIVIRRSKKKSNSKKQKQSHEEERYQSSQKKKKMKDVLNSQNEEQQIKDIKIQKTSSKKNNILYENQDEDIISQAFEILKIPQILQKIEYKQIFEFLSERYLVGLESLSQKIQQVIMINKNNDKKSKKGKSHKKHLIKSKINLKQLTLQELIQECRKYNLISQEEYANREEKYSPEDHPWLAYMILEEQQEAAHFVDGKFGAYPDDQLNNLIELKYNEYQNELVSVDGDEEEDEWEEDEDEYQDEDEDEDGQKQYNQSN